MDRRGVPGSLGEAWDPRDNGITAMRLGLAAFVAFSHAFPLGGFGPDPVSIITGGQAQGGTVAVSAFFVLSGFLLVQSRAASPIGSFLWHRTVRIFPAYWLCLILVALVLAPTELWTYVGANALLVVRQHSLGEVFATNPIAAEVNGSLWTLAPEFICYLALAAMPRRLLILLVPAALVFLTVLHLGTAGRTLLHDLILSFAIGATLGLGRDWIPLRRSLAAMLVGVLAGSCFLGEYTAVAPFVVAYLALYAAVRLPLRWRRDYSYGTYIYAFPVQQALVALGVAALGLGAYLACTAVVVGIAAATSWHLVEHPVLEWGRRRSLSWPLPRARAVPVPVASAVAPGS